MGANSAHNMRDDLLAEVRKTVSIRGNGINQQYSSLPEEVLARLAENYRAHGWPDTWSSYSFASHDSTSSQGSENDWRFLWYQWEHQWWSSPPDMAVSLDVRHSGAPLVGRLLDALKQPLHQLVVYYVNKAVARAATAQMIQARLILALRTELTRTEARLAEIEARQNPDSRQ